MKEKRERNAGKTRQAIIDAAEREFAGKGFYGARVDVIAEQAGINKRMIYAYFISKEELYKKVLFTVYKRMETAERQLQERALSGVALIRSIITMYFDFLHQNPNFVAILMWENLNKAAYLKELPAADVERPTIGFFSDEIRQGKARGLFKPDVDEGQAVISLITICYANFSNCYTLSRLFGRDLCSQEMIEIRKQHTIDIILSYLCA